MSTYINARNGFGSIFSFSSIGSSGTFTDCANVVSITAPKFTRGTVDVTNHGTTDYYEQVIAGGVIRSGEIGFTARWLTTNTQQITLIPEAFNNGTRIGWKITIAGTSSYNIWYGDAYITGYNQSDPNDNVIDFTCSMKITGKPVLATTTT